jgi:ribosomal-protein-alanine N-acetyltransferase
MPTMAQPEPPPQDRYALETRHLDLRALAPGDAPDLRRLCDEPAVRRHLFDGEPVPLVEARAMIRRSQSDFAAGGVGLFGLRRHGEERLIGMGGLFVVEGVGEPELVYAVHPSYWGRGLATEAARAVVAHALEAVGLRRVLVSADRPNAASARVIEKLGARPLGGVSHALSGVDYFEIVEREGRRPARGFWTQRAELPARGGRTTSGLVIPPHPKAPPVCRALRRSTDSPGPGRL